MLSPRVRRLLLFGTVGLVFLGAGRLAFIRGLVLPVRIAGGSMAEALRGAHFSAVCDDCRFLFRFDAQLSVEQQEVVCPNCGFRQAFDRARPATRGQRVLLDRFHWRRARRGELVAFREPVDVRRLAVKRVAGLPGERVAIQRGELLIDGDLVRKPIEQQREVAILVHDDAFRARRAGPRWRPAEQSSGWEVNDSGYRFVPDRGSMSVAEPKLTWLMYHHLQPFAAALKDEGPVLDSNGYNQGVSRQLNYVRDLMLRCRLRFPAVVPPLALLIHDGKDGFRVQVFFTEGRLSLERNGIAVDSARFKLADSGGRFQDPGVIVEYSVFDRQVLLAVNGTTVFQHAYDDREVPLQPTPMPLGIGVVEAACEVSELCVFRDVYYLPPARSSSWAGGRLADDEWIVMGDNSAISVDSRHWPEPALPQDKILGRVLSFGN